MVNSKPCILKPLKRHPGLTHIPVRDAPEKEYITKFMDKNANLKKSTFLPKKHLPEKKKREGKKHKKTHVLLKALRATHVCC